MCARHECPPWGRYCVHTDSSGFERHLSRKGEQVASRHNNEFGKAAIALETDSPGVRTKGGFASTAPPAFPTRVVQVTGHALAPNVARDILRQFARDFMPGDDLATVWWRRRHW